VARGRLRDHVRGPGLDLLCGEAVSPRYDAVHTRRILFVFGEYWIIEDRLVGSRPHDYDLRFQLAPETAARVAMTAGDAGTRVQAPGLTLLVWPPGADSRLEQGWVSPRYGEKIAAPTACVALRGTVNARFLTLLLPSPDGGSAASLRVLSAPAAERTTVEIAGVGPDGLARDRLSWGDEAGAFAAGPFSGCATLAALREDGHGQPRAFEACRASGPIQVGDGAWMAPSESGSVDWVCWDPAAGFRAGQS
jgi:hypothetical protein